MVKTLSEEQVKTLVNLINLLLNFLDKDKIKVGHIKSNNKKYNGLVIQELVPLVLKDTLNIEINDKVWREYCE